MKVISAKSMAELETLAYQKGYHDQDFMEQAGHGIADEIFLFLKKKELPKNVLLLCGKGNNGGDTFVAGRYLIDKGCLVEAILLDDFNDCSPLCKKNGEIFIKKGGKVHHQSLPTFSSFSLIIDGLFGTGFHGEVKEPYSALINQANNSSVPIFAVDIPSGLNGNTGEASGSTILATCTFSLGLPKTGFFYRNGWNYVGTLKCIDFGLPQEFIQKVDSEFDLITKNSASSLIPHIKRNRHKYQAGLVVGLAGSPGMPGASLLSSLAALRTGCGLVRLLHPSGMEAELSSSPYELIKIPFHYENPKNVLEVLQKGQATFIGPGIGINENTKKLLNYVGPNLENPCVIDADALTLFAKKEFEAPLNAIFTPHIGEMKRLLNYEGDFILTRETLSLCQNYVNEKKITLILKGAPTFIFHPYLTPAISPTGNPGMATAGSGDVLTGLLASLLAQGLTCREAALLGTYLHGLSGEFAAKEKTSYSLIASDIIEYLKDAFKELLNNPQ